MMNEVLICGLTGLHSPRESGSYVEKQPAVQKKKNPKQNKSKRSAMHLCSHCISGTRKCMTILTKTAPMFSNCKMFIDPLVCSLIRSTLHLSIPCLQSCGSYSAKCNYYNEQDMASLGEPTTKSRRQAPKQTLVNHMAGAVASCPCHYWHMEPHKDVEEIPNSKCRERASLGSLRGRCRE